MRVARLKGLPYHAQRVTNPGDETIPGLTTASQGFRAKLGDALYALEGTPSEIARQIGLLAKAQPIARDRPFNFDWSLSQIERLAEASGEDFHTFMTKLLSQVPTKRAA